MRPHARVLGRDGRQLLLGAGASLEALAPQGTGRWAPIPSPFRGLLTAAPGVRRGHCKLVQLCLFIMALGIDLKSLSRVTL